MVAKSTRIRRVAADGVERHFGGRDLPFALRLDGSRFRPLALPVDALELCHAQHDVTQLTPEVISRIPIEEKKKTSLTYKVAIKRSGLMPSKPGPFQSTALTFLSRVCFPR